MYKRSLHRREYSFNKYVLRPRYAPGTAPGTKTHRRHKTERERENLCPHRTCILEGPPSHKQIIQNTAGTETESGWTRDAILDEIVRNGPSEEERF